MDLSSLQISAAKCFELIFKWFKSNLKGFDSYILSNIKTKTFNIMNKFSKVLAFVAVSAGIAYLTRKWMSRSYSKLKDSSDASDAGYSVETNHQNLRDINHSNRSSDPTDNYGSNASARTSDYSNSRTQRMYKDLGMTKAQRRRYEADYSAIMDGWEKDNPERKMDGKTKVDQHNATLNAVLNEAQYSIYREWSEKNPN